MLALVLIPLIIVCANFVLMFRRTDPAIALGSSMILSFAFPSYWAVEILGAPISITTASAVVCLIMYLAVGGKLWCRVSICDVAVNAVMLTHIAADFQHEGPAAIPRAYGEWLLPYAAGRYALGSVSRMKHARIHIAIALGSMLLIHALDLVAGQNIAFEITQAFTDWEAPMRAKRYGLVRSSGLAEHPIFYAGALMALIPVAVLASMKDRMDQPVWRYLAVGGVSLFVFILLSRGAVAATLVTLLVVVSTLNNKIRIGLAAMLLIGGGLAYANWSTVQDLWKKTAERADSERVVVIDGEATTHSSTLARLNVFKVYGRAAWRAGAFGYGTAAVTGFPPNLPYMPKEADAAKTVWTIENSYLMLLLRFGFVGLSAFSLMVLSACTLPLFVRDPNLRRHAMILAAGCLSVSLLIFTVYPDYQIILPFLFLIGLQNALVDSKIGAKPITEFKTS